ncbi:Sec1p Ecym_4221 [Eremothecium cymbalariae DBVPG|uniref:Uncharacterized protein n=1 Tax=Eremothecium cymbalariae (strain CBS 270.75 / DBVPG 7215 / KCTC 17166 / NRRL Y-17582) TaxID=931890 RepID=G8JTD5_ERECY|nr:hypothetical protein Ecym_4221 [Eremothecium cymbalariae DBVPG\
MLNLIELQRSYILSFIDNIETEHGIKFLVVDDTVDELLSCLFADRRELLGHVTAVDKIDSKTRKGQPSMEVIYFLSPNKFNINCIDADFSNMPPRYKRNHIRFLPGLDQQLAKYLNSRQHITHNMASLAEIKCGFYPKGLWYFETIGIDQPLQIFFNNQCVDLIERNIQKIVQSLLNICIITGEYPIIRYSEPSQEVSSLCRPTVLVKKLAFEFQHALDNYARQNEDFPPPNMRPRSIFIITDRTLDIFSALVHDFTYQSLAYDLVSDVNLVTNVYKYEAQNEKGEKEEKTSKLSDLLDPDWVELKYQHIADAGEALTAKINEIISKNPLLVDRSKVKTTTDLLSVVAHLKDFDEERRRVTLHKTLIDKCLQISKDRNLVESSELEQTLCSFGLDIDGNRVKQLADRLLEVLANENASITDKVRYIIEYALFRGGLIEPDFVKLLSFIGVGANHNYFKHFMQLFRNFNYIGFKLIKSNPKDDGFKKDWMHSSIMNDPNSYQTSRFIPSIGNILSSVINNPLLLSEELFPYVKDKPIELLDPDLKVTLESNNSSTSLRNPRHKAAWAKTNNQTKAPKQRIFYFILGGITHVELKAAYSQAESKNRDIFIGSDSTITSLQFMQSMEKLSENRAHLRLKDDLRLQSEAPDYLFDRSSRSIGVDQPTPVVTQRNNNMHIKAPVLQTQLDESTDKDKDKDKKRHKFTKFLRK